MPLDDPKKDEKKAEAEETEKPEKKKGLPSYLIYAGISIVMIAAGYFGGTMFLGSAKGGDEVEATAEEKHSDEGKKDSHASGPTEMINIDDIIVNPSGTGGTRFLAASIGFEVTSPEMPALFEKKMPMIRDALISILGSKTIEQLSDPKEKEITRYQIKKRVEHLLETSDLHAVYFTDFVLQ